MSAKRRTRTNPRRPEDVGKPWDADVPLEYLPAEVRRVCLDANENGQLAWAGAWSPKEPGRTAHLIVLTKLKPGAVDVLKEAGFKRSRLTKGAWHWSHDSKPIEYSGAFDGSIHVPWRLVPNASVICRDMTESDHKAGVLAACVCARWALRYLPDDERSLQAVEAAEAWVRGKATNEQVLRAVMSARSVAVDAVHAANTAASVAAAAAASIRASAASAVADAAEAAVVGLPRARDLAGYAPIYAARAQAYYYAEDARSTNWRARVGSEVLTRTGLSELADVVRYHVDRPKGTR